MVIKESVMAGVNRPRRRGRPRRGTGGPEFSKRRILAAAMAEFAQNGFGGARVNEIARRADTNKRMLYHYFGGKEGLYIAVLEEAYAAFRTAERKLCIDDLPPEEGMRRLVEFTFDYCAANPRFIALLNNENLYRGRHVRKSARVRQLYSPLIDTITRLLARGHEAGVFRNGIDPVRLYISVAALAYFYFSNVHTLSTAFGRNFAAPTERTAHRRHVTDLLLTSLRLDTNAAMAEK
jgi:AcrR family transcriptional regulator